MRAVPTLDPVAGGALPGRTRGAVPERLEPPNCRAGAVGTTLDQKRCRTPGACAPPGGMVTHRRNLANGRVFGPRKSAGTGSRRFAGPPVSSGPMSDPVRAAVVDPNRHAPDPAAGAWFVNPRRRHHPALGRGRHHRRGEPVRLQRVSRDGAVPLLLVSIIGLVAQPDTFDVSCAATPTTRSPWSCASCCARRSGRRRPTPARRPLFLVIGLLAALYVSANVMGALVGGLDRVRGVPHRPWVRGKAGAADRDRHERARGGHHARPDRRLAAGGGGGRAALRQVARRTSRGASCT